MSNKWNEEGAPNLNLSSATIKTSKLVNEEDKKTHTYSKEMDEPAIRDEIIESQIRED
ncbi:hypothetical protein QA612_11335 [Evansella sp. AB-P1]|uniref:hypothetical protein n=1 Tax=Evansella sp. AB-P1 TaxID=3037653 RepID=UPI00241DCE75|nr:hypothetical protein [Evansella sp. AB-P1]MDG5788079.1 hypothetical protein [Evansella sp. AB-P1]